MNKIAALTTALMLASVAAHAEAALSNTVLKTERTRDVTYILMSVENKSDQRFEATKWSCVFFNKEQPVHEETNWVENVPPRGRAIKREI